MKSLWNEKIKPKTPEVQKALCLDVTRRDVARVASFSFVWSE